MNRTNKRSRSRLLRLGIRGAILGKHIAKKHSSWMVAKGKDCEDPC